MPADGGGKSPHGGAEAERPAFARVQKNGCSAILLVPDPQVLPQHAIPVGATPIVSRIATLQHLTGAVTDWGVTLAALLGQMVADEILIDCRDHPLAPCHPGAVRKWRASNEVYLVLDLLNDA